MITRGGGSRGDLSWFDQKGIAVAIAQSPLPVITAIGHEIDRSIADVVAHQACKTPTAAAEFLVTRLDEAAGRLDDAVVRLLQVTDSRLSDARTRLQEDAGRLEILVSRRVGQAREGLARQRVRLAAAAARLLAVAQAGHEHRARRLRQGASRLAATARGQLKRLEPRLAPQRLLVALPHHGRRLDRFEASLGRLAPARLAVVRQKLVHLADRARLLDPERLLARGYTLTLSAAGQLLKSAAQIQPGELMRTRFRDGEVASIVSAATGGRGRSQSGDGRGGKKGGRRGGEEEEPGQKSLFW